MLTDTKIRKIKPPESGQDTYADGAGLWLYVQAPNRRNPYGLKFWRYRYEAATGRTKYTIGPWTADGDGTAGTFNVAAARREREKRREQVKDGHRPHLVDARVRRENEEANASTFAAVGRMWLESKRPTVGTHYAGQLELALERDLKPLHTLPIRDIRAPRILGIITDTADRPAWAHQVKRVACEVFAFAMAKGKIDADPTYNMEKQLRAVNAIPERKPVANPWLPIGQVPEFFKAVDATAPHWIALQLGIRLLALTLVRPSELAEAPWDEFNLDEARWDIPEERMKMRRPHNVPLPRQAVAILRELKKLSGNSAFVFPETWNKKIAGDRPKTGQCFRKLLANTSFGPKDGKRAGVTPHGLRATASTYLNGVRRADGKPRWERDWIECQLAHCETGVRARYNHNDYWDDRRAMLQFYADMIAPERAKVVAIQRDRARMPNRKVA